MIRNNMLRNITLSGLALLPLVQSRADDVVVVKATKIITVSGKPIENGAIVCKGGKIVSVGDASSLAIPPGAIVKEAKVVTPGLIDVRTCVGLSGIINIEHDSDQLESSSPLQPELRAKDAYNATEELVEYVRGFGVTTIHTGHGPGELISGQTIVTKTIGNSVEESLIEATEYRKKMTKVTDEKEPGTKVASELPSRNLRLEALVDVLDGKKAMLITADRAQDIATALRFAEEFGIAIWLDSAAEAHTMLPQIQAAKVTVLLHPSMARASGEKANLSFETASLLRKNGIPFAIQGGFEPYVPKARVVLFEAAVASAHGLSREDAIESITLSPAKILGISDRVGSIEVGKDADLALYDGDPLEYTSHCIGVVVNGKIYQGEASK